MSDASVLERAEKPPLARTPACPFYGRQLLATPGVHAALVFVGSDRCALITQIEAHCAMELEGEDPDWTRCGRNPVNNGSAANPRYVDTPETVAEKAKAARAVSDTFRGLGRR